jgi:hypothetical protein
LLFASCSIATTRSWSSPLGTSLRKLSHGPRVVLLLLEEHLAAVEVGRHVLVDGGSAGSVECFGPANYRIQTDTVDQLGRLG